MKKLMIILVLSVLSISAFATSDVGGRIFIGSETSTNENKNLVFTTTQASNFVLYYAADSYDYNYYGKNDRKIGTVKLRIKNPKTNQWDDLTPLADIGQTTAPRRVHWTINASVYGKGNFQIEAIRKCYLDIDPFVGATATLSIIDPIDMSPGEASYPPFCANTMPTKITVNNPVDGYGALTYRWIKRPELSDFFNLDDNGNAISQRFPNIGLSDQEAVIAFIFIYAFYQSDGGWDISTLKDYTPTSYKFPGDMPNPPTIPLSPLKPGETIEYKRIVTDAIGNKAVNTITVRCADPVSGGSIGAEGENTICTESTVNLIETKPASGGVGNYTYEWYSANMNNPASWIKIQNANGINYSVKLSNSMKFRRKIINTCGSEFSNDVTITVIPNIQNAGSIAFVDGTKNVTEKMICDGTAPGNIVSVQNAEAGVTYRWEYNNSTSSADNYLTLSNDNTAYYNKITTLAYNKTNYYYRRAAIGRCNTVYTAPIVVTPIEAVTDAGEIAIDTGTANNKLADICYGDKPDIKSLRKKSGGDTITVDTNNEKIGQYKWQYSLSQGAGWSNWVTLSDDSNMNGGNQPQYKAKTGATQTIKYRRAITGTCNADKISNEVQYNVAARVTAGEIKQDTAICYNVRPHSIQSVQDAGGGRGSNVYIWQYSTDGTRWDDAPLINNKAEYRPETALTKTTHYRRLVTNECAIKSDMTATAPVTVTVRNKVEATRIGQSQSICAGTTPYAFNSIEVSNAEDYQWWKSPDNVNWTTIDGATDESYSAGRVDDLTYYKRQSLYGDCGVAFGNVVSISVYPKLNPAVIGSDQLIFRNTAPQPLGGNPATGYNNIMYQWEMSEDDVNWDIIPQYATGQNFQPCSISFTNYFRRLATDECGVSKPSNSVKIEVADGAVGGTITPDDTTVCYGTALQLQGAALRGAGLQWQKSPDGTNWTDIIMHANDENYQTEPLTETTYFKRKTSYGAQSPVFSNIAKLTVIGTNNPPTEKNPKTAYCIGKPVILEVRTASGYTYYWADENRKKISENYTFTLPDFDTERTIYLVSIDNRNNCEQSKELTIVWDNVKADFSASKTYVDLNGGVQLTNLSTGAAKYEWDFDEGEGSYATNLTYYFNQPGKHTIKLTAESANGCKDEKVIKDYITVADYVGYNGGLTGVDVDEKNAVSLYPNPVSDILNLNFGKPFSGTIEILSVTGQSMLKKKVDTELESIDVAFLQSGVYIVRIVENTDVINIKFVKQ